jgi:arabinofuranosyltransferase
LEFATVFPSVVSAFGEILERYTHALAGARPLWALIAIPLVVLTLPWTRRRVVAHPKLTVVATAVVVVAACCFAWKLIWASDDAYISFRYAQNLVHGNGLVFNPGERVEGYTDFLWTVLMAGAIRLGFDPGQAGIVLSMASFAALLVVLARWGERLVPRSGLVVGLAPVLAGFSYAIASFATSALETVFATALTVVSVERASARRPLVAGLAGILATLAHPDHGIFYAALAAALLLDRECRRDLPRYLLPFVAIFVPYFLIRWSYYGDFMPNTYYAKSGDKTYFEQGVVYAFVTFVGSGVWAVLPLAAIGLHRLRRTLLSRFVLIGVPVFVIYVAKIGGDFMLGRLFVPVLPFVFLAADAGLRSLVVSTPLPVGAAFAWLGAASILPLQIVEPAELFHGIADERTFTAVTDFGTMRVGAAGYDMGHALYREFRARSLMPRVATFSIGMVGYYSRLPLFDLRGLTNRAVAHQPITTRGRPGHEKVASLGQILDADVDLSEASLYPPEYDALTSVGVGGFTFHLTRYEPDLVVALAHGTGLTDFRAHLDQTLPRLGSAGPDRMACDLWFAKAYYFSRNDDAVRKAALANAAVVADPSLEAVQSLLLETDDLEQRGWQRVRSFGFDWNEPRWSSAGDGDRFGSTPVLPEQSAPFGQHGLFLNTFTRDGGDSTKGELTSPEFVVRGDVLTFLIGGGYDPARLRVSLEVEGVPVRAATGCGSEWLDRRVWDISPFHGLRARIVVGDESDGGGGHLVVDDVVEWRARDVAAHAE